MKPARVVHHAGQMWEVARDLMLRRYPPFVTGGELPRGHVPVFVFHSVEPEGFERQLTHLATNGYVALSGDEYFAILMGARPAPERAVLLTFDDGRGSLWSVAAPLLRRFGMRGVVFLVPGRMRQRPGAVLPDWDDVRSGRADEDRVRGREQGDGALLYWEEVASLAADGVFEFQSHSLTHSRIHVDGSVVGFATPQLCRGYDAFDLPVVRAQGRDLLGEDVPLGSPILHSAPRLGDRPRFVEEDDRAERCVAMASDEGPAFFDRPDWEQRLRGALGRGSLAGRQESSSEAEAAIRRELAEARTMIEAHTGHDVLHFCWPWHAAGALARGMLRDVGYHTAFWGKVPGVPLSAPGANPYSIARIGEDYVALLPGGGRQTLSEVLAHKWRRILRRS